MSFTPFGRSGCVQHGWTDGRGIGHFRSRNLLPVLISHCCQSSFKIIHCINTASTLLYYTMHCIAVLFAAHPLALQSFSKGKQGSFAKMQTLALCARKSTFGGAKSKFGRNLPPITIFHLLGQQIIRKKGVCKFLRGMHIATLHIFHTYMQWGRWWSQSFSQQLSANHQRCKFHICHRFGNQSAQMHNPITADAYSIGYDANSIGYHKGCRWMFVRFAMQWFCN